MWAMSALMSGGGWVVVGWMVVIGLPLGVFVGALVWPQHDGNADAHEPPADAKTERRILRD